MDFQTITYTEKYNLEKVLKENISNLFSYIKINQLPIVVNLRIRTIEDFNSVLKEVKAASKLHHSNLKDYSSLMESSKFLKYTGKNFKNNSILIKDGTTTTSFKKKRFSPIEYKKSNVAIQIESTSESAKKALENFHCNYENFRSSGNYLSLNNNEEPLLYVPFSTDEMIEVSPTSSNSSIYELDDVTYSRKPIDFKNMKINFEPSKKEQMEVFGYGGSGIVGDEKATNLLKSFFYQGNKDTSSEFDIFRMKEGSSVMIEPINLEDFLNYDFKDGALNEINLETFRVISEGVSSSSSEEEGFSDSSYDDTSEDEEYSIVKCKTPQGKPTTISRNKLVRYIIKGYLYPVIDPEVKLFPHEVRSLNKKFSTKLDKFPFGYCWVNLFHESNHSFLLSKYENLISASHAETVSIFEKHKFLKLAHFSNYLHWYKISETYGHFTFSPVPPLGTTVLEHKVASAFSFISLYKVEQYNFQDQKILTSVYEKLLKKFYKRSYFTNDIFVPYELITTYEKCD